LAPGARLLALAKNDGQSGASRATYPDTSYRQIVCISKSLSRRARQAVFKKMLAGGISPSSIFLRISIGKSQRRRLNAIEGDGTVLESFDGLDAVALAGRAPT